MFKLKKITLKLFDGAAAGVEGAGADGAQEAANAAEGEVIYGKQEVPDAGEQEKKAEPTPEERRDAYNKLINGEYKDLDTERIQNVINKRFKETKGLQEKADKMSQILSVMAGRYGVDAEDFEALQAAIDRDDSFWEEAADDAGMSVEAFKKYRQTKAELDARVKRDLEAQRDAGMQRQIQIWSDEAEKCKSVYPEFDMQKEAQNPDFVQMLQKGVSVQHAYEVLHIEEIKKSEAQRSAEEAERKVVQSIRAKGARPGENALKGSGGVIIKSDVHSLTKKDRAEIMRRVARGERIKF